MNGLYLLIFLLISIGTFFLNDILFVSVPLVLYTYYKDSKIKSLVLASLLLIFRVSIEFFRKVPINYLFLVIYSIVLIATIFLVNLLFRNKDDKIQKLHKESLSTQGNDLLKRILKLAIDSKEGTITETSEKICEALIEYYSLDYCTLLLKEQRGFNIASSNVEQKYRNYVEVYANRYLNEMELGSAKILSCDDGLSYPTAAQRGINYCYLIHLNTENLIGALLIENRNSTLLDNIEEDFFEIVKENIAIVLQNLINHDKLVTAAMVDGLTQVWNRAYLEKKLAEEIKTHIDNDMVFSIAILDIDHFKRFNDENGHIHGDKVLKELSQFIAGKIRMNIDFIARYGGEEFVIFFRKASNKDVYNKLDSIREEISLLEITNEQGSITPVTASFGLAEFPKHGQAIKELIEAADKALYYSKQNGRNKVSIYDKTEKYTLDR